MLKLARFTIDTRYATGPKIVIAPPPLQRRCTGPLVRLHHEPTSDDSRTPERGSVAKIPIRKKELSQTRKFLIKPPDTLLDDFITIVGPAP